MNLSKIEQAYLLCTDVPCYRTPDGGRYLEPLWHKDLLEHARYLTNLTIACPIRFTADPSRLIALDDADSPLSRVKFTEIPYPVSLIDALRKLPSLIWRLWAAVGKAEVCHAGVASWPIALLWLVLPIARLRKKFVLVVVESSGWRLQGQDRPSIRRRLRSLVSETFNRWCIERCDLVIFTHEGYARELLSSNRHHGHVIPASWIDADNILTDAQAADAWGAKHHERSEGLKLLFAGQLVLEKGILNLLAAIQLLGRRGFPVRLDVLGSGPLAPDCLAASQAIPPPASVQLLGIVDYGPPLFRLIGEYDAVIVPSVSDEQPRILFDAYSQGVPVLVTPTDGLRTWVQHGRTGLIAQSSEPDDLANVIISAAELGSDLEGMGMSALEMARRWTGESMHRARWELLVSALDKRS